VVKSNYLLGLIRPVMSGLSTNALSRIASHELHIVIRRAPESNFAEKLLQVRRMATITCLQLPVHAVGNEDRAMEYSGVLALKSG
jgi:hypothetical protein